MCNLTIHPNFIGYHKCGYANCPICKNAITNSQYWYHIRSHPGHENDSPPLPREKSEARGKYKRSYSEAEGNSNSNSSSSSSSSRSFGYSSLAGRPTAVLEVGKEYEVDVTEISRQGDGIARVRGFVVFVKNAKVGQKVRIRVEHVGNRYATATMAS
ncbi:MAG TPA: TRAM domain-containing protein [Nitrososphaeraceae archaeon]|nr:TRAM domain-containing protein [Nitrososphaeraceae archaeon]